MTIFGKRNQLQTAPPTMSPAQPPRAPSANPMDEPANVFEHIIFPDDNEEAMSSQSDLCTRGSDDESSQNRSSSWDSKSGSEEAITPSTESGDSRGTEEATEQCPFAKARGTEEATEQCPFAKARNAQAGCRFSKEARSVLRTWYHEHRQNPYPSSEEKDLLVAASGLKRSQISLWLANTRRKDRARQNEKQKAAAFIPNQQSFSEMNPFDRWKVTPIELEAVAPTTIMAACEDNPLQPMDAIMEEGSYPTDYNGSLFGGDQSTANFSSYDAFFAQSMASYDTNLTSLLGAESISDHTQFSFTNSLPGGLHPLPKERRRRRVVNTVKASRPSSLAKPSSAASSKPKPFHCTFCTSSFSTKHDWARHEKSQHLSLESWVCCQNGGTIVSAEGLVTCAFCTEINPDKAHLETHNFSACQVKEAAERTFYRKDHFMQHLRLTHECKILPKMSVWKQEITDVKSRCGFCSATFDTWTQRAEHLAAHFKCRTNMEDWIGDWGFEAHIVALIERAPRAELLLGSIPATTMGMATLPQKILPPVPMFSQQEIDNAVAYMNYQLPTDGFNNGLQSQMPMVYDDNSALDAVAAAGNMGLTTDSIDWAQFIA